MGVELMIYFYGAVCLSMIVFNVAYAMALRSSQPRMERRKRRLAGAVETQLRRLGQGKPLERRHLSTLQRRLRRVNSLTAFDQVLRPLFARQAEDPRVAEYLTQLQPCILALALVYQRRESIQAAYFSYFLSRYMAQKHMSIQSIQDVLLSYMAKENLYCRVNALQALCSFGSARHILTALEILDRGTVFFHEKILTETLLSYTGNHDELIALLWTRMDSLTPHTQLALLNYIRFRSGGYTREMMALMADPARDKEVSLAAIRYFGRYPYPPALPLLLSFAQDRDLTRWEYATVAVSSLARYQGPQVVQALKQTLHSPNWYVRCAAAASLEAQHMDYLELMDIVDGSDRYAREIMTYQLESHRAQKAGV